MEDEIFILRLSKRDINGHETLLVKRAYSKKEISDLAHLFSGKQIEQTNKAGFDLNGLESA